ncbi:hypothetical protein HIM_10552 [Hirsutella minnesotensis 3608]|uniref:MULE transposase domain-containing protein n=1 Tax=Hirsutella minnesotensis 3608 TaxID=1043627 RepID=A0A0F7ZRR0_9HYPO|nr:hypothetical protein HIM_10552 [Hirsutella minnesotensis 3608]
MNSQKRAQALKNKKAPGRAWSSSQSVFTSIPNPPIPGPAALSIDALQFQVKEFARDNGFSVVRHNGSGSQMRKTRYVFQCDRYGEPRPPRGAGLRQKRSRKCGCKWKVIAEALEQNDYKWTLRLFADPQHSQDNHDRSISHSAHPVHRRLTASVKATIEATSRRVGIRARDVRGIVKEKHPGTLYTGRDIYNARALLRREKLGGLGPTAALIKLFDERGIPYIVKWSSTEPDRLVGLIWSFPYCLRMWKRFPETLSFDNAYNTNRFKLPLFQVTGQTCLKSVYNAAFGLIDNEKREGFQFLAEGIRQLNEKHDIPLPEVVITDYDKQMKAALDSQFPDSQQQISLTSGDIAAVLSVGDHGDRPLRNDRTMPVPHNYRGVLEMWKYVAFARTKEDYEKAWVRLCEEFNDQQAILMYLCKTYLPLGIPCRHTIYNKLEAGTFLTKWDVHPLWHLREPTSRNPYRRILDPKIAITLRGRPKNTPEPVPEAMAIKRLGRECRGGRGAVGKIHTGRKPKSKTLALRPGKQTGVRQAGRRRQPSRLHRNADAEVPESGLPPQRLQPCHVLAARRIAEAVSMCECRQNRESESAPERSRVYEVDDILHGTE